MVTVADKETLRVEEAAALLGIGRERGIRRYIHRGEIPVLKIGRKFLVPKKALIPLLDGQQLHPVDAQ